MENLKYSSNGEQFREEAKDYVINMLGKKRKLHKKYGCQWAKDFTEYYDFNSKEEAKESGIAFTYCEVCFKEEMLK